jgi:hypothetical protein
MAERPTRERATPIFARKLACRWSLSQICIKCQLLEFSEKSRLIRIEYGQKAGDLANSRFKPSC